MESQVQILESTNNPLNDIQFSDIFNLKDLQHLQDLFADANGVASIITHVDGTPITNPSNFCRLCSEIIRKTEKGCENCLKSDAALGLQSSSGPVIHQCLSGGLWDAGARISVGGKHIANWIIGQVRNDELDIQRMIAYADEIGVDREDFLDALNEVPGMSVEQFDKLSIMLFLVANEHSERAYNNWLLKSQIAEKEKARVLLEEYENRFQVLFNKAPFGYQSLDFDGHFIEVNQQWLDTLGFIREEVIGKWFGDFLSPAYQDGFRERFPIFKAKGKIHSEFEMIHKNGKQLFIAFDGTIGYGLNGEFKQTHCILQDITQSRQEERIIRESEKSLREAQRLAHIGNWKWVMATDTITWSEELYRINGRDPDSAVPSFSEMSSCYKPESWKRLNETVTEAIQNGEPYELELEIVLPDDTTRYTVVRGEADWDDDGKIIGLQGTVQDITERKQTEKALSQSNELNALFMKYSPIYAFIKEVSPTESRVLIASENFSNMIGIPSSEIVGKTMDELFPAEFAAKITADDWLVVSSGQMRELDEELNGHNYTTIKFPINFGNRYLLAGYTMDVTEHKIAEDEIKLKNDELIKLNADKDRFMSILGHDLRSPFNGILGFLEILSSNIREYDMDTIESQINIVETSAKRVFFLLEDLLMWSRSQSGLLPFEPQKLDLAAICLDILSDVKLNAATKNISVRCSATCEIPIFADPDMLKTVLRNLISNALKFSNQGGKIEILTRLKDSETIVSVSDNGVGMTTETVNKLFNISQVHSTTGTANETGTGLGLLLCKEFVEKHQGKIWVESQHGKGSVFYFSVPNFPEPKEKTFSNKVVESADEKKQLNMLNILIADDNELSTLSLTTAVNKIGKEVITAKNGYDAVEACMDNPHLNLVLMDIQMPGMDGYEATRQIRLFNQKVVIIAQTAYGEVENREKAIKSGCNDYLQKPIKRKILVEVIGKYFEN